MTRTAPLVAVNCTNCDWKSRRAETVATDTPCPKCGSAVVADGGGSDMQEESFTYLRPDQLVAAKDNPRREVGDVTEMAESMKGEHGILEPLIVAPIEDGTYEVIAGHRRLAAAELAGLLKVPCMIRPMSEQARLEAKLIENMHRENLNPIEEAEAYRRLEKTYRVKQVDLARRVGRSQSHISKRVSLLKLPRDVRAEIYSGGISLTQAELLLPLRGHPKRIEKVLAHPSHQTFEYSAKQQTDELKKEERRRREIEEFEASDTRKVEWDDYVEHDGDGMEELRYLHIKREDHEGEPCHAGVVGQRHWDDAVIYICTDPSRHRAASEDPGAKVAGIAVVRDPEKEARFKTLEQREEIRRAHVRSTIADGLLVPQDVVRLMLACFTHPEYSGLADITAVEVAPYLTDLEVDVEQDSYYQPSPYAKALTAYTEGNFGNAIKSMTAAAVASIEPCLTHHYSVESWAPWSDYFAWLEEHDYEVSGAEREMLALPFEGEDDDDDDDDEDEPPPAVEKPVEAAVVDELGAEVVEPSADDNYELARQADDVRDWNQSQGVGVTSV